MTRCLLACALLLLASAAEPDCLHGENRNPITGECACLFGYTGQRCETLLFPSCRTTLEAAHAPHGWPPAQPCRNPWGTSCACLRECHAERNRFDIQPHACFERSENDSAAPSLFPEEDEPGVSFWSSWRMEERKTGSRDAIRLWDRPVLPLSACPSNCSHEGRCVAARRPGDPPACSCPNGLRGAACEEVDASACFLSCSEKGVCVRGVCVCQPGWFGMGCTEPVLDAAALAHKRESAVPPRQQLAIYVWELPPRLSLTSLIDNERLAHEGSGTAFPPKERGLSELTFLYQLMGDERVRVRTPWEANLFLVPTFAWGVAAGFGGDLMVARVKRLIAWLRANPVASPLWERYAGADFAFWTNGDLGACTLNRVIPVGANSAVAHEGTTNDEALQNVIIVSEYGQTDYGARDSRMAGTYCMRSIRGIVVPPGMMGGKCVRYVSETAAVASQPRPVLFSFYGTLGADADRAYSQHVRQDVAQLFSNVSGFVVSGEKQSDAAYMDSLRSAVFCLAPSGYGYGVRITFAMLTGCIPVIIQDGVRQPLDDVLPYWKFALRIPQKEIPNLERILRAVTPEELSQLRHHQHAHHASFCWHLGGEGEAPPPGARAYEAVLESMRRKVYQLTFQA